MIAVRLILGSAILREQVFEQFPVTIGRGPESDFVLFDPSISRAHARIDRDEEGQLVLSDLGSKHGLMVGRERVKSAQLDDRLRVRLGQVDLELERLSSGETQDIQPEDRHAEVPRHAAAHLARDLLLGLIGSLALIAVRPAFWSPWKQDQAVTLLYTTIGTMVALPVLSFLLLMALRGVGRRVGMAETVRALMCLLWLWLIQEVLDLLSYYPLSPSAHGLFQDLLGIAAVTLSIVSIAEIGRRPPLRRFRLVWGTLVAALLLATDGIGDLSMRISGTPRTDYHVQVPLGPLVGPAEDLAAYQQRIDRAAHRARAAAEAVRRRQEEK